MRLDGSITPKAPLQMQSLSKRGTPTPPALSAGARQVYPRSRSVKEAIRDPSGVSLCPGLFLRSFFSSALQTIPGQSKAAPAVSGGLFYIFFQNFTGGLKLKTLFPHAHLSGMEG